MHLLFDEQLSEDLRELLRDDYPDLLHVRQLGFGGASDESVWELAGANGCGAAGQLFGTYPWFPPVEYLYRNRREVILKA